MTKLVLALTGAAAAALLLVAAPTFARFTTTHANGSSIGTVRVVGDGFTATVSGTGANTVLNVTGSGSAVPSRKVSFTVTCTESNNQSCGSTTSTNSGFSINFSPGSVNAQHQVTATVTTTPVNDGGTKVTSWAAAPKSCTTAASCSVT